jgi:hypothetical protein
MTEVTTIPVGGYSAIMQNSPSGAVFENPARRAHPCGIELIVAFADEGENHHGGIYQASNFVYKGSADAVA